MPSATSRVFVDFEFVSWLPLPAEVPTKGPHGQFPSNIDGSGPIPDPGVDIDLLF